MTLVIGMGNLVPHPFIQPSSPAHVGFQTVRQFVGQGHDLRRTSIDNLRGFKIPAQVGCHWLHVATPANSCVLTTFHTVSWMTSASFGSVTLYGSAGTPFGFSRYSVAKYVQPTT